MYTYQLAILALPCTIRARSLSSARSKLIGRYAHLVGVQRGRLPVVPTILLLSTDDPRVDLPDRRLVAPETLLYNASKDDHPLTE